MKRRNFIKYVSASAIPFTLNGFEFRSIAQSTDMFASHDSDKVLVLIQLIGGNDGLNTLIPLKYYDNLANVRSNVIVPESSILKVTDDYGFHPSLPEFNDLYQRGFMHVVQGVAYPNQDRSHFRSTDIWSSASSADELADSGWLGRYFETMVQDFPNEFPNDAYPHPFALTVGSQVSETCQGTLSNFSLAINKPEDLLPLNESDQNIFPNNKYGEALSFISESIEQTNAYGVVIKEASEMGNSLSDKYTDDNDLAQQLKSVAQLISGGLGTSIYVVTLGGFDTHANQVVDGDQTNGIHANLLRKLSSAVGAFWDDCELLGLRDRVMGMTFSEFGRQIKSNASFGTDHGTAAPMFMFGNCLNAGLSGDLPVIGSEIEFQEGVPMQFDFKSVYGNILTKWFQLDNNVAEDILNHEIQDIDIFGDCFSTSILDENIQAHFDVNIYPNPTNNFLSVQMYDRRVNIDKIFFFDLRGGLVNDNVKLMRKSSEILEFDLSALSSGNYFIRLEYPLRSIVKKIVKF